ncbi:hypothetical protein KAS41_00625 [Candidatus Parcubacteria bacterium]|nr:hypothetical protein [Candidatus Parcubacteria bacterium]
MRYLKEQSGTVILLGIIITMVILIIGSGISVLVISEIKQSGNIDKSATAYYLAEYGLEDGLYEIRKRGKSINNIDESNVSAASGSWSRTASDKRDDVAIDLLSNNEYTFINLYDFDAVDAEGESDYHANIDAITVECHNLSTSTDDIAKIEIKIFELNLDTMNLELSNNIIPNQSIHYCKDPENEGYTAYSNTSITTDKALQIKIRAIGDAYSLIFKAYTDNNCSAQAQIMDKQIIKSSGTYIQTKAGLQAEMELEPPW